MQTESKFPDEKCCTPVYYKGEQLFCAECIRATLLVELKRTEPNLSIKCFNKRTNSFLWIKLLDLSV